MRKPHLVIFSLIILFVACSKESKPTVTFWHVMGGPLGKRLDEMIGDFNKIHPEGAVKSVHMGSYDALAQKLMGAVSSNSPPVIAQMYESWTDQFLEAGFLYPLEEFVEQDSTFILQDFYTVFIDDNTFDSTLVTLPFNKSVPVFYYNIDILESVGIDSFPKDWANFRKTCEAIKQTGIWPTSWPIDVWYFSTMLYQFGGRLYDEQTKRPLFNSPKGIEVLEYIIALVKDSLFYLNPGFQRQDEFLAGNVAIVPASVVSWAFMKDKPLFRMGVAPFPKDRFNTVVIAGTNVGMFKKSTDEQKKLAWEFIKWFLMPENQIRWTEASYYLPTRHSATRTEFFKEFLKKNPGYDKIVAQLDSALTEPKAEEWFVGRIYLNQAIEEAVRLERTAQDALDKAARRLRLEIQYDE